MVLPRWHQSVPPYHLPRSRLPVCNCWLLVGGPGKPDANVCDQAFWNTDLQHHGCFLEFSRLARLKRLAEGCVGGVPLQNIRRPAKGQRKRIRKQSDAGAGEGGPARKDAEARMREDLFGADNAGALL